MRSEELLEIAALARLDIDESELAAMLPVFEQMVEYFAEMQKADDDFAAFPGGLPDESGLKAVNAGFFSCVNCISNLVNENILNNAGERDGRFIVIQNVLDKSNGV